MGSERAASRRRYSAQLKAQVLAECDVDGASVARVAMARGINANVVHRWRQQSRASSAPKATAVLGAGEFVPIAMAGMPAKTTPSDIRIELRRGTTAMSITWPIEASSACASWMRELLR
jgi:transposase